MGYDDPDTKKDFSALIMDLYNGARKATISSGEQIPSSTVVISSNMTPIDQQRYNYLWKNQIVTLIIYLHR